MTEEQEELNPFDEAAVKQVQLVVQMRIYDVLMGIYRELNEDRADAMHEMHEQGKVIGALPWIDV